MGFVQSNSYRDSDGHSLVSDERLVHELNHACANYFKQLYALGKSPLNGFKRDSEIAETIRFGDGCKLTPTALLGWKKLFGILKIEGGFSCLQKTIAVAQGQISGDKCDREDFCPGSYYEEAAAQLMDIKYAVESKSNIQYHCTRVRDVIHPRQSDLVDCLMQNDPKFREEVKALGCGGDSLGKRKSSRHEK